MNQVVERVFLGEKITQRGVAGVRRLMKKPDVAARAKGTKRAFLACATHGHGQHLRVILPTLQCNREVADHGQ